MTEQERTIAQAAIDIAIEGLSDPKAQIVALQTYLNIAELAQETIDQIKAGMRPS